MTGDSGKPTADRTQDDEGDGRGCLFLIGILLIALGGYWTFGPSALILAGVLVIIWVAIL